jgi:ferric-dicitrate binding protein FerR (iron transport regulator)
LLVKHLLSETTAAEQEQVREWLIADEANLVYYNQLKKIWDESRALALATTADENKAWKKFQQRVQPAPVRRASFGWMKVAASIIVVIAIGTLAYWGSNRPVKEMTVLAQKSVLNDTLPDGSVVTVNKGSSISYPSKFKGDTRKLALKGEAFFNVTPNKEKPFIISVNDVLITVMGTSFNVKSINGSTEVVVESGIVKVTKAGNTVEVKADEKIRIGINDSVLTKEEVSDQLYKYYRTKEFICDETPLWKLVDVINEAYHSNIVIGNPALRDMTLTTTFNNESLEQVLNVISITFNIKIIKEGSAITLQ